MRPLLRSGRRQDADRLRHELARLGLSTGMAASRWNTSPRVIADWLRAKLSIPAIVWRVCELEVPVEDLQLPDETAPDFVFRVREFEVDE